MTLASHQDNYTMLDKIPTIKKSECLKYHTQPDKFQPFTLKNGKIVMRCQYCERWKAYETEERKKEFEKNKKNLTDKYVISTLKRNTKLNAEDLSEDLIKTQRVILTIKKAASLFECKKHNAKERSDFIKAGKYTDGTQRFKCKKCMHEMHQQHYLNNKEKVRAAHAKYKKENPIKFKEVRKKSQHKCRLLNPYKFRIRERIYQKNNLDAKKVRQKRYKTKAVVTLSDQYIKQQLVRDTNLKHADIPQSLVELKKTLMMIRRKMKVLLIEEKNDDDENNQLGTIEE